MAAVFRTWSHRDQFHDPDSFPSKRLGTSERPPPCQSINFLSFDVVRGMEQTQESSSSSGGARVRIWVNRSANYILDIEIILQVEYNPPEKQKKQKKTDGKKRAWSYESWKRRGPTLYHQGIITWEIRRVWSLLWELLKRVSRALYVQVSCERLLLSSVI